MWMVHLALRRPVTIFIAALSTALLAVLAFVRMPVDIFPNLNLPVIVVAQPYGGMDPGQMEGFLVYYYEYHFLYITGIDHVESKSIQNVGLVKLYFHPGTDMSQALAQTVSYVDRARAFMKAHWLDRRQVLSCDCRKSPGCGSSCQSQKRTSAVCDRERRFGSLYRRIPANRFPGRCSA